MKKSLVTTAVLILTAYLNGQTVLEYSIPRWFKNKPAAACITFDDNYPTQFSLALQELKARGIPATFFVCTNSGSYPINWDSVVSAYNAGYEIGSHTVTHPNLRNYVPGNLTAIEDELRNSRDSIRKHLPDEKCISIAWPYGEGGTSNAKDTVIRNIAKRYYVAGRNAGSNPNGYESYNWFVTTDRFFHDRYFRVGANTMGPTITALSVKTWITNAINNRGWCNFLYHGIETGGSSSFITPVDSFRMQMDTLLTFASSLWITCFGNANRYHQESNTASLNILSEDTVKWVLQLTDAMEDSIFDLPVTLRIRKPAWAIDSIKQGNTLITHITETDTIQFDAVPDGGSIEIYKSLTSIAHPVTLSTGPVMTVSPNPLHQTSTITVTTDKSNAIRVELYDLTGIKIREIINSSAPQNPITIYFERQELKSGIYLLKMTNGNYTTTQRMIIQ